MLKKAELQNEQVQEIFEQERNWILILIYKEEMKRDNIPETWQKKKGNSVKERLIR